MNKDFPFPGPTNGLTLATVVMDETSYCTNMPEGVTRVQGVYLFAARVAMHICSFQAGTDAIFVESVVTENGKSYDLSPDAEAFRDEVEQADHGHESGYRHFSYIDVDRIDPRLIAKVGTFRVRDMIEFLRDGDFSNDWDNITQMDKGPERIEELHFRFIAAMAASHSQDALPTPAACEEDVRFMMDKLEASRHMTCYAETEAFLNRVVAA